MRLRALSCAGVAVAALAPAPALGAWSAPAWVSARDGAAYSDPDVAVAARGRALAAFVRTPAGSAAGAARVQLATRDRVAGPWRAPKVLSGRGARAPKVALNDRGDAVVAWVAGAAVVAATRRGPSGAWRVARVVSAGGPVQDLRVAVDRAGRPVALWSERRGDAFLVRIARRTSPRAPWAIRPARLATPGPLPPALAVSRSAALVAWVDDSGTRAARTANGRFEEPVEVASTRRGTPGIGLSADGGMVAAWSVGLPGGTSVVLTSERPEAARRWSGRGDAGIGASPLAAVNDRGDAVVSWPLAGAGAPQGIEASTRRAGGRWEASTVVARRTCACALTVGSVAIDGAGTAIVGWRRDDGEGPGRGGAAAHSPGAGTWVPAPVRPGRTDTAPATAAGARGGLTAWVEAGRRGGVRVVALTASGTARPG